MLRPLLALVIALLACAPRAPALVGTELGAGPAPDFTLIDGLSGRSVMLSALRGQVVALAFLYTRCPDVCPLTAQRFRAAQRALGADAKGVTFVAVSVDPAADTPQAARDFSLAHELRENWHYLIGPRAALEPVWSAYGIRAVPDPGKTTVTHSDAIFLIDASGRERVLVHSSDAPEDLSRNLRTLLAERGGGYRR